MRISILPAAAAALMLAAGAGEGFRDRFLRGLVLFGIAVVLLTEGLSVMEALRPWPLFAGWAAVLAAALALAARRGLYRPRLPRLGRRWDAVVAISVAGVAAIVILTGITAAWCPPDSADAMAYHMPRVLYWAEQGSVRFFPTQYLNQIMLQPLAEYLMLHTYVLSGGDRFVNFVQWLAALASILGVSAIARQFGCRGRGQAIAALFCATIPGGVLASSGAKNDYFMAFWLVAMTYFTWRFAERAGWRDAAFAGGALGLALLTKATAYLYAPWFPLFILLPRLGRLKTKLAGLAAVGLFCVVILNGPQYFRNYRLSGSIMGYDSATGDGVSRWRNETFGWRQTVSNLLRNTSEQLGARSEAWNQGVYDVVAGLHRALGIDLDDPDTTWRGSTFKPPQNANHEANAPNRWQVAALLLVCCVLAWQGWRGRHRELCWYALALLFGFASFSFYLKWQPYTARMFVALFVLGAPLVGVVLEQARWAVVQVAVCVFLLSNVRLAVLQNWVRPLTGPASIFSTSRDDKYFSDLGQLNNRQSYWNSLATLERSGCRTVGMDITNYQWEYPLEALLRERRPGTLFVHVNVANRSAAYRQPVPSAPCAVVCFDCAGDAARLDLYQGFPRSVTVDKFVIFLRPRPSATGNAPPPR